MNTGTIKLAQKEKRVKNVVPRKPKLEEQFLSAARVVIIQNDNHKGPESLQLPIRCLELKKKIAQLGESEKQLYHPPAQKS